MTRNGTIITIGGTANLAGRTIVPARLSALRPRLAGGLLLLIGP